MRDITDILLFIPGILIGLALHEFAHGYVAYLLGDNTAKHQGRLTINPLAHLDPAGTLMMIISMFSGFGFGWAKPVPIQPVNFTRRFTMRKGIMLVSLAGPMTNFLISFLAVLVFVLLRVGGVTDIIVLQIVINIARANLGLGIFNLLPVPPLDGSKILMGFLPARYDHILYNLERYGTVILLLLLISGAAGVVIGPLYWLIWGLFESVGQMFASLFI